MKKKYNYTKSERNREQIYRGSKARSIAIVRLIDKYPNLYRKLYEEAKIEVNEERGELPPLHSDSIQWRNK